MRDRGGAFDGCARLGAGCAAAACVRFAAGMEHSRRPVLGKLPNLQMIDGCCLAPLNLLGIVYNANAYAIGIRRMPYANGIRRMPPYAAVCRRMPPYAAVCHWHTPSDGKLRRSAKAAGRWKRDGYQALIARAAWTCQTASQLYCLLRHAPDRQPASLPTQQRKAFCWVDITSAPHNHQRRTRTALGAGVGWVRATSHCSMHDALMILANRSLCCAAAMEECDAARSQWRMGCTASDQHSPRALARPWPPSDPPVCTQPFNRGHYRASARGPTSGRSPGRPTGKRRVPLLRTAHAHSDITTRRHTSAVANIGRTGVQITTRRSLGVC